MIWNKIGYFLIAAWTTVSFAVSTSYDDFRTPKTILFSVAFGGSSHVNWVLNIMDELGQRGHHLIFFPTASLAKETGREDHVKFGKAYPRVETILAGPSLVAKHLEKAKRLSSGHPDPLALDIGFREILGTDYAEQFRSHRKIIDERNIDVVLCDHLHSPCFQAAQAAKIPAIITIAVALTPDAAASFINNEAFILSDSTTQYESFFQRFYKMFILQSRLLRWKMGHSAHNLEEQQRALGLEPHRGLHPSNAWKNSLKLVNNVFGLEAPRSMGPLVELVGPIMPNEYQPLTKELKTFLDSHHKVAYIAFGQLSQATTSDIQLILTALLDNLQHRVIDGILWATVHAKEQFPNYINGSHTADYSYNIAELLEGNHPSIRFVPWAPQHAVLQHPSVAFFVTHGGAGSLHEALSSGKRLIAFPFFFDQHANARNIERSGLGRFLDYKTSQHNANKIVRQVAMDEQGHFQANVDRYKALIQIHGKHGAIRGADLVEEVAFMHRDGLLPHRYEASRDMPFIKVHNLDLFVVLVVIILLPIWAIYKLLQPSPQKVKAE
ncbi:hypothetical protein EC973_005092 [Apophysomyces ossiformis]|uniref:UDP-Glycosyltransferase/glycogen phosphorylase n=1 Tax=Apophysomyces ossiformis TaxID=679940 RepID=A0A8H7BFA7_9FUNG|nr:hypothetical protein EC973_005092 [Apophysomyces ossiformis]